MVKGAVQQKGTTVSGGNKITVFYNLNATAETGKDIKIAERISGRAEAELLKESY